MNLRSIGRPAAEADAVFTRALEQVAGAPGVASAAISATVPFGPTYGTEVGVMASDSVHHYSAVYNVVTPNYFRTLGTSLLAGRDFSDADRQGTPASSSLIRCSRPARGATRIRSAAVCAFAPTASRAQR